MKPSAMPARSCGTRDGALEGGADPRSDGGVAAY